MSDLETRKGLIGVRSLEQIITERLAEATEGIAADIQKNLQVTPLQVKEIRHGLELLFSESLAAAAAMIVENYAKEGDKK